MSDLADFLLARIAEDEEAARAALDVLPWSLDDSGVEALGTASYAAWEAATDFTERMTPARVLAECKAMRRIVEMVSSYQRQPYSPVIEALHAGVLRLLALPYAGHEDYRSEWKP